MTSEVADENGINLTPLGRRGSETAAAPERKPSHNAAYSVTISSAKRPVRESMGDINLPIQTNVRVQPPPTATRSTANPLRRRAAYEANNAAWSYTKCAILFFTAMLVTWIPSSANRVYSVMHTNDISMPLEYMSAFVLPLQGFWNALIYIVTSWRACKVLASDIFGSRSSPKVPERLTGGFRPDRSFQKMNSGQSPRSDKNYESESMTELAVSRPSSHDRAEKGSL